MSIVAADSSEKLWDDFLAHWPLESLKSLRIDQYTKSGGNDSFIYWLEFKTEQLGSIAGGSAFKFGVYHRGNDQAKQNERGRMFGNGYAWYEKYGQSAEDAFNVVRDKLVTIAEAARRGDLESVDAVDLGPAVKWKIAFLYQNREKPCLLPIYKLAALQVLAGSNNKPRTYPDLYAHLLQNRGDKGLFQYANELWEQSQMILSQKLSQDDALSYLQTRFSRIKEPVQYMAGFRTPTGRQIGLVRNGKVVTAFVEPNDWPTLVPGISLRRSYEKNEPRISSLEANAPKLYVGHPADLLEIPTLAALSAFCDAYGEQAPPVPPMTQVGNPPQSPKTSIPFDGTNMNRILYGPPGTGKTYRTAAHAVATCDGTANMPRDVLMARYEVLRKEGRISFVTFHQSYGYEDFVEGLRPESKDGQVTYRVRPGIFREICDAARRSTLIRPGLTGKPLKDRTIYKMSLGVAGTTEGNLAFQECVEKGYVLLGWGEDVDFTECSTSEELRKKLDEDRPDATSPDSQVRYVGVFKDELQVGDIVVVSQGNKAFRAIGVVTGEYEFLEAAAAGDFHQMRPVRWLAVFEGNRSVEEIYDRSFVQSSLYRLDHGGLKLDVLEALIKAQQGASNQPFVLIIDEINRANISKVFGELITLIEPDKREGAQNAITVKLPYSGDDFSVPSNLFIVGTMNTADRSIALLDTALRRRFEFEELQCDVETLQQRQIGEINLSLLLQSINERIEFLYDRDHAIGHAYFINVETMNDLEKVFRRKVIPLLQEYFYEDWSKVRLVLNDKDGLFVEVKDNIPKGLEAVSDGYEPKPRYRVRDGVFSILAYLNIYQ